MTDLLLTPIAYETLRLFADGAEIGPIASTTNQPWMTVRNLINIHASGHRTTARTLLDSLTPPTPEQVNEAIAAARTKAKASSQLTAPLPAVKAKVAPVKPSETEVYVEQLLTAAPPIAPMPPRAVDIHDLIDSDRVMEVAINHPVALVRDKAAHITELLAELRDEIIRIRRDEARALDEAKSAAREKIVQLEAELAQLRELVSA